MHDMQGAIGRLEPAVAELKSNVATLTTNVATLTTNVAMLTADVADLKVMMIRMDARLDATLPHLATKADLVGGLAEKPSKTYMWGILAALLTAYACGLAALAVLR